ncbi:MAG: DMT family transporter [Alphaproteobacteria bacterium]|nr:DMT family transporter [Alphaproteobacteria bacterium]
MAETPAAVGPSASRVGLIPNLLGLGLFWGLSPVMTKALAQVGVTPLQTITYSSLAVGVVLFVIWRAFGPVRLWDTHLWFFGLGCAIMLNLPFGLSLIIVAHVPVSTFSIVTSTTPLFGYLLALMVGMEKPNRMRILAIIAGFLGAAFLIIDAKMIARGIVIDPWLAAAFGLPFFYAIYHLFAAKFWPKDRETSAVGIAESLAAGLAFLPLLLVSQGRESADITTNGLYLLAAVSVLWVIERIAFFNLVRHFGPVSTVQAVNLATVSTVIMGAMIYGEEIDARIIVSAALVIIALWLNAKAERQRQFA